MTKTTIDAQAPYDLDETPAITQDEPAETAIVPFQSDAFAQRLARVKMLGTYRKAVELEYGEFDVIGCVYCPVAQKERFEAIDEDTGEVTTGERTLRVYHQLKLKLKDGRVMMSAGRGADRFYHEDLLPLGFEGEYGDFPQGFTLRVKVQSETLKGKTADGANKKWPVFTII